MDMDIRKKYEEVAMNFVKDWRESPNEHIMDIIVSVMMHRDGVQNGGGFVTSVCNNDLVGAVSRADGQCIQYIKLIALAKVNAFV
jgi:hypothetical protein